MTPRASRVGAVVLAALSAACASAARSGDAECRSNLEPHERTLNEVADSAVLARELASAWDGDAGLVLARLRYDSAGVLDSVEVLTETLTEPAHSRVLEALRRAAWPSLLPPPDGRPILLIGDESGPRLRRLGRVATCPPGLLNRETVTAQLRVYMRNVGLLVRAQVRLTMLVGADGRVERAQVVESSGLPTADLAAARAFEEVARWLPARIEGIRIPTWVTLPVTLNVPDQHQH